MSKKPIPEELLLLILDYLKPSLAPGSGFRHEDAILQDTLYSWIRASKTLYRLAEPVLYHTITSDKLSRALEHVTPSQRDRRTGLVRELYVNQKESHAKTRPPGRFEMSIAERQVEMCTNLQVLVLASTIYPRDAQWLRNRVAHAPGQPMSLNTPLANLCRFEMRPTEDRRVELDLEFGGWFLPLTGLPWVKAISVPKITIWAFVLPDILEQPSNLKSLALTNQQLTPGILDAVLKAFPSLEELSVTWPKEERFTTAADIWPQLGQTLLKHGPSLRLRKIHFECRDFPADSTLDCVPINLAHLHGLQSLALPRDAVLPKFRDRNLVSTTAGGAGHALPRPHGPGQDANKSTVPLSDLLPPTLQHLTIMDDRNMRADAKRLDTQLRNLMRHSTFSELRSIRLRRNIVFDRFEGLDWFGHYPDWTWQVMMRMRGTRRGPELPPEPWLREIVD